MNCNIVDVSAKNCNFKKILFVHKNNNVPKDCDLLRLSQETISIGDDDGTNVPCTPQKRTAGTINLDIKKKKLSTNDIETSSKVLILKSDAIEKVSHVSIQSPNYKSVKRKIYDRNKLISTAKKKSVASNNGKTLMCSLKQKCIDNYFYGPNALKIKKVLSPKTAEGVSIKKQEMSKNFGVADAVKADRSTKLINKKLENESPRSARLTRGLRSHESPKRQELKTSGSDAPRVSSPKGRNGSVTSHSPKKYVETIQFNLPAKSRSSKAATSLNIPYYKIVAGTHFAVDAFSYGEIPNVKHYFLTHFHSDHYSGLKRGFNKWLYCSAITANLCVSRLGVNPKCIHTIEVDETITIEGVEVAAVDANHCPGAIMLVFTLPNGKTLLHTGDFRATPIMESYPIFWNREIHTVYLDTTYCNPRYDFPTQDESLEMALYLLRQKKLALEKMNKKFSSVLIVCGTYTIGKEKFFLGMARRVGCSVWACPEKDRVLQAVEGKSFSQTPPQSCQLHVVPMKDLTHEKLRCYLEGMQGAFSEVVAFKPSGWENGKNTSFEKDQVTIHGIPYSEHSSFSEMIRFVKYLKPRQVIPTVDISGGIKAVQKYFPCPLVYKEDLQNQSKIVDYFSIQNRPQISAVT